LSLLGGRGGRNDDWPTPHQRAQARAAERLDSPLDPDEARWLDAHLADCGDCSAAAADYAAQRLELRALRQQAPVPPRDLWARTAASIEREARHRSIAPQRRSRRASIAPYALLAGALVVAIVIGSLSSIRQPGPTASAASASPPIVAAATTSASAGPTPLAVSPQDVAILSKQGTNWKIQHTTVDEVCSDEAGACATTEPGETTTIGPLSSPASVFGSDEGQLVIVGDTSGGSSVYALTVPDKSPGASPTPSTDATASPSSGTGSATPSATPEITPPIETPPVESPTLQPSSASPTIEPPEGAVEIARGVDVLDSTAAYSPDGMAFAFTARPSDLTQGPDIYLWRVGEPQALPVTTDHHSVFGSWDGSSIVGSTVTLAADGATSEPSAFILSPETRAQVALPQAGLVWRPAVDPTRRAAVYWAGTLEPSADGTSWTTVTGRLVLGRWSTEATDASASPPASASPSPSPVPTTLKGNQAQERSETTLASGPIADWDARWDETGTRLAIWIADANDPKTGRLSLYVVDPFDGRINLENPPLRDERAAAGFSLSDGRLAWATPATGSSKVRRVQILAWTDEGFGKVESAEGDFLLVR
jgi:hypothetical protein